MQLWNFVYISSANEDIMFAYDKERLTRLFGEMIARTVTHDTWTWLTTQAAALNAGASTTLFNIGFVAMPRRTGKTAIALSPEEVTILREIRPGTRVDDWTIDRLARVWWLLQRDSAKADYNASIENLFLNGEMNELVALYSALPFLAYPEQWKKRCAEGIRSNIGQVLEAIMCNNPYPSEQLDEPAWNQLVLKAIFTEKPLLAIYGLKQRANETLAESISAFAHERWAARRQVNPLVWTCVTNFVDERIFSDIERLLQSVDGNEKIAGALVCTESNNPTGKKLLDKYPDAAKLLKYAPSWEALSERIRSQG